MAGTPVLSQQVESSGDASFENSPFIAITADSTSVGVSRLIRRTLSDHVFRTYNGICKLDGVDERRAKVNPAVYVYATQLRGRVVWVTSVGTDLLHTPRSVPGTDLRRLPSPHKASRRACTESCCQKFPATSVVLILTIRPMKGKACINSISSSQIRNKHSP